MSRHEKFNKETNKRKRQKINSFFVCMTSRKKSTQSFAAEKCRRGFFLQVSAWCVALSRTLCYGSFCHYVVGFYSVIKPFSNVHTMNVASHCNAQQ